MYGTRLYTIKNLHKKFMFESHVPPYARHRGIQPTTQALETHLYWPLMSKDIQKYVEKCVTCQKVKYDWGKAIRLLQPLPIPNAPWESISMDFIFRMLKSIQENTRIWNTFYCFSKQDHFIPIKKTRKVHHMARLFIDQVFKYHGLLTSIVSYRDRREDD